MCVVLLSSTVNTSCFGLFSGISKLVGFAERRFARTPPTYPTNSKVTKHLTSVQPHTLCIQGQPKQPRAALCACVGGYELREDVGKQGKKSEEQGRLDRSWRGILMILVLGLDMVV